MASPPPRRWPWKPTAACSPIQLSISSTSSSSSFNSLSILTVRCTISRQQPPLATSSADASSSVCQSSHNMKKRASKSLTFGDDSKNESSVAVNCPRSRRKPTLSFKSLLGRRSLWRRPLFNSRKVRSIILLNVTTFVYVVKEVEGIMDPAAFTVVRFVMSALPFVLRARGDAQTRNAGIELGFWVSLGYLMQALGLLASDAGRASFISMFTVIVVPLLDGLLGAIVPARTWFGALMSVLGVAMLETSGSPPSVGDLLNFMSAVFFGVHMLRTEHISRSTEKENFLALLGYEVSVVAFLSTLWYFVGDWFGGVQETSSSSWTWTMFWDWMTAFPWIPALYTGMFSTGLCLWVEMAVMRDVSATETAIIYGLEPVWGAGFAWVLLDERWGMTGWIGAALVLGGSLIVQIFGSSSTKLPKEGKDSRQRERLLVSDELGCLSSPIVVNSRKNAPDVLNK